MEPYKPSKKQRRRVMVSTLIFCAANVSYIVFNGGNDQTHVAALYALIGLAASVIGLYIHGSSKDTASFNDTLVKLKNGK